MDFQALLHALTARIAALSGTSASWSVWLGIVGDGTGPEVRLSLGNRQVWSASLIKLYVMAAVLQAIEAGTLPDSPEIRTQLHAMIADSSNAAWISLASALGGGSYLAGMEQVNVWCDRHGYACSGRRCELDEFNTTSAQDTGRFLSSLLRGTCVSRAASARMLELLKQQNRTWKIPAGIPAGVSTANKTGELGAINNDAAIVFAPFGTYILVILTKGGTVPEIAALSAGIYRLLEAGAASPETICQEHTDTSLR